MPMYEFRCCACGAEFEAYCSLSGGSEGIKCPSCGKEELERLVSRFSAGKTGPLAPAGKSCPRRR